jgi:hypothetical protein
MKSACQALRQADDTLSKGLTAYKTRIDQLIFVYPRLIPIHLPPGARMGRNERPLRAETAQGPRVSVVASETVPAGSTLTFQIHLLKRELLPEVWEWLQYGAMQGLGQWRSGGHGKFVVTQARLTDMRPGEITDLEQAIKFMVDRRRRAASKDEPAAEEQPEAPGKGAATKSKVK